jgi:hypothetical protein
MKYNNNNNIKNNNNNTFFYEYTIAFKFSILLSEISELAVYLVIAFL